MSFARNLFADLVARRLWPVAVVLLVAVIAIPLAMKGDVEPVQAPASSAPAAPAPAVSVGEPGKRGGSGPIGRDPFDAGPGAAEPSAAPSGGPTASAAGPASASAPAAGASSAGGSTSGASSATRSFGAGAADATPVSIPGLDDVDVVPVDGSGSGPGSGSGSGDAPRRSGRDEGARDSWHVDVRFGPEGDLAERKDVARLTALPDAEHPAFVFLGVLADGETALFLVAADAQPSGDAGCLPSVENCRRVELRAGDKETFDVRQRDGATVRYQLDLVSVRRKRSATAAVSRASRARESRAGRAALRRAAGPDQRAVADIAYSRELGLVLPTGRRARHGGTLFGGFRVDLRFGAAGDAAERSDVARLTALPSHHDPALVFLGVLAGGREALFLNPTGARTEGDGDCEPSPEECRRLKLATGQTARIAGAGRDLELRVERIASIDAGSRRRAAASRARESRAGRGVLRRLVSDVRGLVDGLSYADGAVVEERR